MNQRQTYAHSPAPVAAAPHPGDAAARVSRDLLDALGAQRGMVCLCGAGGKKSIMYRIAAAHPGRVGLTSTVHIHPYDESIVDRVIVSDDDLLGPLAGADAARVLAFARSPARPNRLGGIEADKVAALFAGSRRDICLIKADGARGRWIKAPAPYEPVIPAGTDLVVSVVSARAFGMPLSDRIAHRPARVAEVTGAAQGEVVSPLHVARLLASPRGALYGIGNAPLVPVINMVDDRRLLDIARLCAREALALTDAFDQVVLACLRGEGFVEVVRR